MKWQHILIFISISILQINNTHAGSVLTDITNSLTNICQKPSEAGKYWDVSVGGKGDAKIKLLLGKAKTSGTAHFSTGEWEGTKNTIEGSMDYRDCVEKLAPVFIEKFSHANNNFSTPQKSKKLGGISWTDEHDGVQIRLENCERSGSNTLCNFKITALNTDKEIYLSCRFSSCPAHDQDGNTFYPVKVAIGNQSDTTVMWYNLVQGISTKMAIQYKFHNTSTNVSKLTIKLKKQAYTFKDMQITL